MTNQNRPNSPQGLSKSTKPPSAAPQKASIYKDTTTSLKTKEEPTPKTPSPLLTSAPVDSKKGLKSNQNLGQFKSEAVHTNSPLFSPNATSSKSESAATFWEVEHTSSTSKPLKKLVKVCGLVFST